MHSSSRPAEVASRLPSMIRSIQTNICRARDEGEGRRMRKRNVIIYEHLFYIYSARNSYSHDMNTNDMNVPFAKCEVSAPNSAAAARTSAIAASMSGVIASRSSAAYNRDDLETTDDDEDDEPPVVDGGGTNAIAGDSRTTTTIERMTMMDDFMLRWRDR